MEIDARRIAALIRKIQKGSEKEVDELYEYIDSITIENRRLNDKLREIKRAIESIAQ